MIATALVLLLFLIFALILYLLGETWLTKIFKVEFGQSDLQGNYSRTYSWMANQLGHMTLGLGTTLALYWLIEFLGSALSQIWPSAPADTADTVRELAETEPPLAFLLVAGLALAAVLALNWTFLSGRPARDDKNAQRFDLPEIAGRRWWWLRFTTVLVALGAILMLGALYVSLAAHAAFWFRWIGGIEDSATQLLLARDTFVALGAAGVALSIWVTKEFCSDQSGIGRSVAEAAFVRAGRRPDWSAADLRPSDCPAAKARAGLLEEGWWDSATDGFFYVTGAAISVGVVASHPDPTTAF
ncbi:MAG TPA: hypothetical protein VFR34_15320, partial [Paracoccaceae bacterium]|nr:hypothetical protein [Paracoccaceae bacterium]